MSRKKRGKNLGKKPNLGSKNSGNSNKGHNAKKEEKTIEDKIKMIDESFVYDKEEIKRYKERFKKENKRNKNLGIIFYCVMIPSLFIIVYSFSNFLQKSSGFYNIISDTIVITAIMLTLHEIAGFWSLDAYELSSRKRMGFVLLPDKAGIKKRIFLLDRFTKNPIAEVLGENFRTPKVIGKEGLIRYPIHDISIDFLNDISADVKGAVYFSFIEDEKNISILRISILKFFYKTQDIANTVIGFVTNYFRTLLESKLLVDAKRTVGVDFVDYKKWGSFVRDFVSIGLEYETLEVFDIVLNPEDVKARRLAFVEYQKKKGRDYKYLGIVDLLNEMEKKSKKGVGVTRKDLQSLLEKLETLERLGDVGTINLFGSDAKSTLAALLSTYNEKNN